MVRDLFQGIFNLQSPPVFIQLPGGFPEDVAGTTETERSSTRLKSRIWTFFLKPPLLILYFLLSTVLFIISGLRPLRKLAGFYDRSKSNYSKRYPNQYQALVTNLLAEEELYGFSSRESLDNSYSFYSLYNAETGILLCNVVRGDYNELINRCVEEGKLGLVYLHDPLLADPFEYLHRVLCKEEVVNAIKRFKILIWFGNVINSEGAQVANQLKARQFPFIGILTLRDQSKMQLVCRLEGKLFDFMLSLLEPKLQSAYSKILNFRRQRQNRELQRFVVEQQELRHQVLEDVSSRQQLQETENELKLRWLLWRNSTLKSEPTEGEICKLSIRTDTGRLVRSFDASLPIEEIYAFVELHLHGILNTEDSNIPSQPPNYNYIYGFKLVTPVIRVELDQQKLIRDEHNIYPSGTVVVEQRTN